MNQITGYQDGSNIYGSNLGAQRELREFSGGRLRIQNVKGRQYLPDNENECANEIGQTCFKSGTKRSVLKYAFLNRTEINNELQETRGWTNKSIWRSCTPFGWGSITGWPENCKNSTRPGATKLCFKKPDVLSLLKCSTSRTTNFCPFYWVGNDTEKSNQTNTTERID